MASVFLFEGFSKKIPFVVTERVYRLFQECSNDLNPLHVNDGYSKSHGFRECVMYGNILNAFISYAIGMELPTKDVILLTQSIQYKKPVYLNDSLIMELRTESFSEAGNSVTFKYKFSNNNKIIVAKGDIMIGLI